VLHQKGGGKHSVSADTVYNIEQAFKVVHMRLKLYAYEVKIVQEIKPNIKPLCEQFAVVLLECFVKDENFLRNADFNDEATLKTVW
jgi:hypothetical protein